MIASVTGTAGPPAAGMVQRSRLARGRRTQVANRGRAAPTRVAGSKAQFDASGALLSKRAKPK